MLLRHPPANGDDPLAAAVAAAGRPSSPFSRRRPVNSQLVSRWHPARRLQITVPPAPDLTAVRLLLNSRESARGGHAVIPATAVHRRSSLLCVRVDRCGDGDWHRHQGARRERRKRAAKRPPPSHERGSVGRRSWGSWPQIHGTDAPAGAGLRPDRYAPLACSPCTYRYRASAAPPEGSPRERAQGRARGERSRCSRRAARLHLLEVPAPSTLPISSPCVLQRT